MARLALPHFKSYSLESLAKHFGLPSKTVPYNLFKGVRDLPPETQRLLEEGCKHDVELTYEIFKRLLPFVSKEELQVIDLTIRMYTEPTLQLDTERMHAYLDKTIGDKEELLRKCGVSEEELASSAKFASCLRALGVEPPTKISKTTGKETLALAKTDAAFKELCDSDNPLISALCAARLGVKSTIAETRAGRMLSAASRGPLPVYLKYYGAHTGRWSGGDKMNWQNFPRGGEIRQSILAPEGYVLCVVDLSQIECRMLNWLAGQEDVLDAFRNGRDLYCEAASRFYGRNITKTDKAQRQIFKSVELGCGYGMGATKFKDYARQSGSPVSEAEAADLIKFYRHSHEMVCRFWRKCEQKLAFLSTYAKEGMKDSLGPVDFYDGKIVYPNGGYQVLHGLHKNEDNEWHYTLRGRDQKVYGGLLAENITQALSRVLLSQAMLEIAKRYKIVMSTHDEVVYLAPESEAEEAYQFGVRVMTTNPAWCKNLPLAAEGGYARNYSK
jgi:DNA polymerase